MHMQLLGECETAEEALELTRTLTLPPEQVEAENQSRLLQELDLFLPGSVIREGGTDGG